MQGETFCFLISLWTKRLESNPRFQEINKNVAGNWLKGPWKSASIIAVSWSISLCERGSRRKRVWGQRRMRLGAEAVVSGSRGGCVWEQRRMQTGRSSLTSWEFVFTRHRGCPLRDWFELHQACRPRLASESRLTDGAETSRSRLTADAAKRLL